MCEGASEIGLLRGLDLYRIDQGNVSLAALGVALLDCGGGEPDRPYARAATLQSLGYRVMVLRDDDKKPTPTIEQTLVQNGGTVVAYRTGRALENELFCHLHAGSLPEADQLRQRTARRADQRTPAHCLKQHSYTTSLGRDSEHQRPVVKRRAIIGQAARIRKAGWFKSISWMENVARTIVAPDLNLCDPGLSALMNQIFDWAAHGVR